MEINKKVDMTKTILFDSVTGKEFIERAIIETDGMFDLRELGFYLVINDTFFIIDECYVTPGAVEVRNTEFDMHYTVEMEETGMIWVMSNKELVWDEVD